MSAPEKAEVATKVSSSPLPKRKVLRELGIPKSTYYRWLRRQDQQGLEDRPGGDQPPWNRLTIQEERSVLLSAREMPDLSCRQPAAWVTDNMGFSVSESTVYRILRREGLVKRPEMRLVAGKERHRKTTGPHQMWAIDASYFRVVGWGLLPPGHRHGRRLPLHPGLQASTRYDIRLLHRGGPRCGGQDRYGPGPNYRPDQAAERQRPRIRIKSLQGLPGHGGHQAYTGNTLPPSDQQKAGALPPDPRIQRLIATALGDAQSVVNVGAGTGNSVENCSVSPVALRIDEFKSYRVEAFCVRDYLTRNFLTYLQVCPSTRFN